MATGRRVAQEARLVPRGICLAGRQYSAVLDWGREEEEEELLIRRGELWWTFAHKSCYLHLPTPAYSPCFFSSAV
jgi:hypothetical protein